MVLHASIAGRFGKPFRAPLKKATRPALLSWALLAVAASACGSSGGNSNDAGPMGDGASTGLFPPACTKQVVPKTGDQPYVISDFASSTDGKTVSWGFSSDGAFSGYSFSYPDALVSDMSTMAWHLSGTVGDYAGFAFGFSCAVDASMFTGISLSVKGDAGATARLIMSVGTSPNDVNEAAGAPSFGKCVPKTNRYDGTCQSPKVDVSVTSTMNVVKYKWSDFKAGAPQASVSADSITGIVWIFDWIAGATPFPVDVTIDDVAFTVD